MTSTLCKTQQEAVEFVQQLLSKYDKEFLEVFYKQNRFHNNEITKLKEKIAHHKKKLEENGEREKEFRWLCKQAKKSDHDSSTLTNVP